MHKFTEFLKVLPGWQTVVTALIFFVGLPITAFMLLRKWLHGLYASALGRVAIAEDRYVAELKREHHVQNLVLMDNSIAVARAKPKLVPEWLWMRFIIRAGNWHERKTRRLS